MIKVITYRATNQKNGKWYVGSTVTSFKRRKREHLGCKPNTPFHNALRKDPNSFVWEVLSEVEEEELKREHEPEVLDCFFGTPFCYNLNRLANGFSSEQASAITKSRWETEEFRNLMSEVVSESNRLRWRDEEYRSKMVEMARNNSNTEDHKLRLSKESKERWEDPEFRKMMVEATRTSTKERWEDPEYAFSWSHAIELVSLETGEVLRFNSIREASRSKFSFVRAQLSRLCNGNREEYRGFKGRFLTKEEALELYYDGI